MILVRGTVAVGGKLTPRIWPSVVFFGFLAVAILYSQAREDGDVVRFSTETDGLSVQSGQGDQQQEPAQDGSVQDSFSHTRSPDQDHGGIPHHTHP